LEMSGQLQVLAVLPSVE